jgi:hypothetical protein
MIYLCTYEAEYLNRAYRFDGKIPSPFGAVESLLTKLQKRRWKSIKTKT